MSTTSQRMMLNLGVFRAATTRASIGQVSVQYATTGAALSSVTATLVPGQTFTYNVPASSQPSSCLVLHTTAPLRVDAELDAFEVTDNTGATNIARDAGSQVFKVTRLLVLDDAVTGLVLENISTTQAVVTIHQG